MENKKNKYYCSSCPSCGSKGFKESIYENRCEFCDGTEGGNPPCDCMDCVIAGEETH